MLLAGTAPVDVDCMVYRHVAASEVWLDTGSIPSFMWYWDYSQLCGMTLAGAWSLLSHGQG